MSANYLTYRIPSFEWTDRRRQQLKTLIQHPATALHEEYASAHYTVDGWRPDALAAVDAIDELADGEINEEETAEGKFLEAGGVSYGDRPNRSCEVFDDLAQSPQVWQQMLTWMEEDIALKGPLGKVLKACVAAADLQSRRIAAALFCDVNSHHPGYPVTKWQGAIEDHLDEPNDPATGYWVWVAREILKDLE